MTQDREVREAIDRLLAAYPLLLDSGDITGCAELFVDEAQFIVNGEARATGRDGVTAMFQHVVDSGSSGIHLPGPPLVEIAGDGLTATVWQSFLFVRSGSNTVVRGMYRDVAERDGDRWRFRSRDVEIYPGPTPRA